MNEETSLIFQSYEQDFIKYMKDLKMVRKSLDEKRIKNESELDFDKLDKLIDQSVLCIQQMEQELQISNERQRKAIQQILKKIKIQLNEQQNWLQRSKQNAEIEQKKHKLIMEKRSQTIQKGEELVNKQGDDIRNINRMSYDTEQIALNLQKSLLQNTQTISRSIKNNKESINSMKVQDRIIQSMNRKVTTNKLMLFLIIICLAILDSLVFFFKLKHLFH